MTATAWLLVFFGIMAFPVFAMAASIIWERHKLKKHGLFRGSIWR